MFYDKRLFSGSHAIQNVSQTKPISKMPNGEYFQDIYYVIPLVTYQKIEGEGEVR